MGAAAAVVYAAKSTADERGSIPAQIADCRAAAEAEGRTIVAEYHDESASAWKGNRGPGLKRALRHAEELNGELWVQHSDRLARGDGKRAKHLVEYSLWALKTDVTLRSVQDPQTFGDLLYAVVTGQRNTEDSDRKSAAVRAGLKRRADRGEPVGAIPEGYTVLVEIVDRDQAVTRRIVDIDRRPIVDRIMDSVEAGHTFGDVARALNADGLKTRRGAHWTTRAVRRIALNEDYTGTTGYPQIIDPERHARIVASLKRLPTRQTGRRPTEDYMLRGVAFCGECGASLYTRRYASGRHYLCSAVRQATGTCTARRIPAGLLEAATLLHLRNFKVSLNEWLDERALEANTERDRFEEAIDQQTVELRKLQLREQRAREQYAKLLDAGDDLAPAALREAERYREDAEGLQEALQAAEQRLQEWQAPKVDAALDYFGEIVDVIKGQLTRADGIRELNATLRDLLVGAWVLVDGDRVRGQFRLRVPDHLADTPPEDLRFAIRAVDCNTPEEVDEARAAAKAAARARQTERQTFVNGPVCHGVEIPPMEVPA